MNEEIEERLRYVPSRNPEIAIKMGDDPELFELLNKYKRNLGWTWKRLFLIGVANSAIKQGDSDVAVHIANYLEGRR